MSDLYSKILQAAYVGILNGKPPRWFLFLYAVICIPWVLGVSLTLLFHKNYLPSHVWLEAIEPFATILGATVALTFFVLVFLGWRLQKHRTGKSMNDFVVAGILILSLPAGYLPTADLLNRGIPGLVALAFGDRVEHQFVISWMQNDPERWRYKNGCRRQVHFRETTFFTQLCGVPPEFYEEFDPGMPVIFAGNGTWMGLFVDGYRKP